MKLQSDRLPLMNHVCCSPRQALSVIAALLSIESAPGQAVRTAEGKPFTPSEEVVIRNGDAAWYVRLKRLKAGQVARFEPGEFTISDDDASIRIRGTPERPIVIRGAGHGKTILRGKFTGKGGAATLYFTDSANVIVEDLGITNPSAYGVDGRYGFFKVGSREDGYHSGDRGSLRSGVLALNSENVTIRRCRFFDIATRGVFSSTGSVNTRIEQCLLYNVGDDTASSAIGNSGEGMTVRDNLMFINVSGFNNGGATTAPWKIERNIIAVFHEGCGGLKNVIPDAATPTTIGRNVFYVSWSHDLGLSLNRGTKHVRIFENVFKGAPRKGGDVVIFRGRNGGEIADVHVYDNIFDSWGALQARNRAINFSSQEQNSPIGPGIRVHDNTCMDTRGLQFNISSPALEGVGFRDITISDNLFSRATFIWNIVGEGLTYTGDTPEIVFSENAYFLPSGFKPWQPKSARKEWDAMVEDPQGALLDQPPPPAGIYVAASEPSKGNRADLSMLEDEILAGLESVFGRNWLQQVYGKYGFSYRGEKAPLAIEATKLTNNEFEFRIADVPEGGFRHIHWNFGDRTADDKNSDEFDRTKIRHAYDSKSFAVEGRYQVLVRVISQNGEMLGGNTWVNVGF